MEVPLFQKTVDDIFARKSQKKFWRYPGQRVDGHVVVDEAKILVAALVMPRRDNPFHPRILLQSSPEADDDSLPMCWEISRIARSQCDPRSGIVTSEYVRIALPGGCRSEITNMTLALHDPRMPSDIGGAALHITVSAHLPPAFQGNVSGYY